MDPSLLHFYERSPSMVCVDTRLLKPGDLFFALPGARVHGHHFVYEALDKGASGAVVGEEFIPHESTSKGNIFYVPDPLAALQDLARRKMAAYEGQVIAITGSVGKTTTKEFLCQLLSGRYRVCSTPGNSNSQIGLPLAILNHVSLDSDIFVAEMGMTHPGNISTLVSIAPPHMALLTSVALVHAENFSSLDAIAGAKAEIFSHPRTHLAIIHENACQHPSLAAAVKCPMVTFGSHESHATFTMVQDRTSISLCYKDQPVAAIPIAHVLGMHNHLNLMAASIAAFHMGIPWDEIPEQAKCCQLPKKRLQLKAKNGITFIDDSYNASAASVKASLECMASMPAGKRIAVLGQMMELGAFSTACHAEVAALALDSADVAIFMGKAFADVDALAKHATKVCVHASTHAEIVCVLRAMASPGDVVLLKGSNSAHMGLVFDKF
jgi:UDP-N-acetylmuramoyl-tripeptide--D-alanyl-D-alanine ligase